MFNTWGKSVRPCIIWIIWREWFVFFLDITVPTLRNTVTLAAASCFVQLVLPFIRASNIHCILQNSLQMQYIFRVLTARFFCIYMRLHLKLIGWFHPFIWSPQFNRLQLNNKYLSSSHSSGKNTAYSDFVYI